MGAIRMICLCWISFWNWKKWNVREQGFRRKDQWIFWMRSCHWFEFLTPNRNQSWIIVEEEGTSLEEADRHRYLRSIYWPDSFSFNSGPIQCGIDLFHSYDIDSAVLFQRVKKGYIGEGEISFHIFEAYCSSERSKLKKLYRKSKSLFGYIFNNISISSINN